MTLRMLNTALCPSCKKRDLVIRVKATGRGTSRYYCGRCQEGFDVASISLVRKGAPSPTPSSR